MKGSGASFSTVVPAKAGTHTPQQIFGESQKCLCDSVSNLQSALGLWVPVFAGTTLNMERARTVPE